MNLVFATVGGSQKTLIEKENDLTSVEKKERNFKQQK
jgi:hypothetical protein